METCLMSFIFPSDRLVKQIQLQTCWILHFPQCNLIWSGKEVLSVSMFSVYSLWFLFFELHVSAAMMTSLWHQQGELSPDRSVLTLLHRFQRHVPRLKRKLTFTFDEEWWELRRRQLRSAVFFIFVLFPSWFCFSTVKLWKPTRSESVSISWFVLTFCDKIQIITKDDWTAKRLIGPAAAAGGPTHCLRVWRQQLFRK